MGWKRAEMLQTCRDRFHTPSFYCQSIKTIHRVFPRVFVEIEAASRETLIFFFLLPFCQLQYISTWVKTTFVALARARAGKKKPVICAADASTSINGRVGLLCVLVKADGDSEGTALLEMIRVARSVVYALVYMGKTRWLFFTGNSLYFSLSWPTLVIDLFARRNRVYYRLFFSGVYKFPFYFIILRLLSLSGFLPYLTISTHKPPVYNSTFFYYWSITTIKAWL